MDNMIQAVIFDMDGLMIDSEPIQSKSFEIVLREYGKTPIYNDQGIVQTCGISAHDNWLQLKAKYDLEEDVDTLIAKKRQVYIELLKQQTSPMPGLLPLLHLLKRHRLKIAIASSSAKDHIDIVVANLNIREYFNALISAEQVKASKPAPDVYLAAALALKVNPSDCLVLEDAESGTQAAKAAGMYAFAIPNDFTKHQDFSAADKVLPSLKSVTWKVIESLHH